MASESSQGQQAPTEGARRTLTIDDLIEQYDAPVSDLSLMGIGTLPDALDYVGIRDKETVENITRRAARSLFNNIALVLHPDVVDLKKNPNALDMYLLAQNALRRINDDTEGAITQNNIKGTRYVEKKVDPIYELGRKVKELRYQKADLLYGSRYDKLFDWTGKKIYLSVDTFSTDNIYSYVLNQELKTEHPIISEEELEGDLRFFHKIQLSLEDDELIIDNIALDINIHNGQIEVSSNDAEDQEYEIDILSKAKELLDATCDNLEDNKLQNLYNSLRTNVTYTIDSFVADSYVNDDKKYSLFNILTSLKPKELQVILKVLDYYKNDKSIDNLSSVLKLHFENNEEEYYDSLEDFDDEELDEVASTENENDDLSKYFTKKDIDTFMAWLYKLKSLVHINNSDIDYEELNIGDVYDSISRLESLDVQVAPLKKAKEVMNKNQSEVTPLHIKKLIKQFEIFNSTYLEAKLPTLKNIVSGVDKRYRPKLIQNMRQYLSGTLENSRVIGTMDTESDNHRSLQSARDDNAEKVLLNSGAISLDPMSLINANVEGSFPQIDNIERVTQRAGQDASRYSFVNSNASLVLAIKKYNEDISRDQIFAGPIGVYNISD